MIGGIEVIDFHGHAGLWDGTGMVDDVDRMVAAMDAVGVDRSCIFGIFHLDGRRGNDRTAAMIAARPERFIGFAYVSPLMTDTMLDELTRAVDRLGFRALKLYAPYTTYKISDPQWDPIYAFADAAGAGGAAPYGREVLAGAPGGGGTALSERAVRGGT